MLSQVIPTSQISRVADVSGTAQLVSLWLHGKSKQTARNYETDIRYFVAFLTGQDVSQVQLNDVSLATVTLNDIQAFADWLEQSPKNYSSATRNRRLSAIKSLLAFGHKVGYLQFDVGAPVEVPSVKNTLAERILSELETMTMIALESNPRNKLLIRFLYLSGARVSEVAGLKWRDLKAVGDRGQATLFGKGEKTRIVPLPASVWKELQATRGRAGQDEPVFKSRKHGALQPNQIREIIAKAGKRAGIEGNVSPHWLRHSHASHSLDRGAPVQLVQSTLGHASVATTSRYLHARPGDGSSLYLPG